MDYFPDAAISGHFPPPRAARCEGSNSRRWQAAASRSVQRYLSLSLAQFFLTNALFHAGDRLARPGDGFNSVSRADEGPAFGVVRSNLVAGR